MCALLFAVVCMILTASSSSAYILRVPVELNRPGARLFNSSLTSDRIYSLSSRLSSSFVNHFMYITPKDGLVFLKKSLLCSGNNLSELVPRPLHVYIESHSFRISGSSTQLILIPLIIYFEHKSCPPLTAANSKSMHHHLHREQFLPSYALLSSNEHENNCFRKSQFITNLIQFVPSSVKNRCNVRLHSKEVFGIEEKSKDLVILDDFCLNSNQLFNASVMMQIDCSYGRSERLKKGNIIGIESGTALIELTFHSGFPEIDDFFELMKTNLKMSRSRREMRNHAPFFDKSQYVVSIPEEKDKGYVITTMSATDPESTEILYSMNAVVDARSQSLFSMDTFSGIVTTTSRLDREFMNGK